jgi:hypothetical protein
MNRKRGRPKQPVKIGKFVKLEEKFARLMDSAEERKGLGKAKYLQVLMTIGDKLIPNRPKLLIQVQAVRKNQNV